MTEGEPLKSEKRSTSSESSIEALREEQERLAFALASSGAGVWDWDASSGETRWDARQIEIYGLDPKTMGRPEEAWAAAVHPEDRERVQAETADALAGEGRIRSEYRIIRPDGEVRHIRGYGLILRGPDGIPRRMIGVTYDVTEEKRAEAERDRLQEQLFAAQKLEAVGTLAAGVAHDFNNILTGLMSTLSLLQMEFEEEAPNPRVPPLSAVGAVDEMLTMVERGAKLTQQLLGLGRRGKIQIELIDLPALVDEVSEMFGQSRRDVRVRKELDEPLDHVRMDRSQLEQTLLNLFLNAGHAMPDGGQIVVRAENQTVPKDRATSLGVRVEGASGRFVRLTVRDGGMGMDDATRQRVFEPFFTTRDAGSGLGLASVYGIVTNHGGHISVTTELGQGTTFTLLLPSSEDRPRPKSTPPDRKAIAGTERILVVDDEVRVLRGTARLLTKLGYDVLEAEGGRAAVEIVRAQGAAVDLMVLDMTMPGMSGASTYDAIRELQPDLKVLLVSGYAREGQAEELLERGCADFLQKPFTLSQLLAKVRALLS